MLVFVPGQIVNTVVINTTCSPINNSWECSHVMSFPRKRSSDFFTIWENSLFYSASGHCIIEEFFVLLFNHSECHVVSRLREFIDCLVIERVGCFCCSSCMDRLISPGINGSSPSTCTFKKHHVLSHANFGKTSFSPCSSP